MNVATPAAILLSAAILTPVGQAELARADRIARSSEMDRARFHAAYVFTPQDPTVERLEIITEFRRAVLAGEDRLRMGDHMFGLRVLEQAVKDWHDRVTIRVDLRFHPQNVLISVPDYRVIVGTGGNDLIQAIETKRTPTFGLLSQDQKSAPIVGATIEAVFSAAQFGRSMWPVRVVLNGEDVAATSVDFGNLQ